MATHIADLQGLRAAVRASELGVIRQARELDRAMGNATTMGSTLYGAGHDEVLTEALETAKAKFRVAVAALVKAEGELQYSEDEIIRGLGKDVCGYCHVVEPGRHGYECAQCGGM